MGSLVSVSADSILETQSRRRFCVELERASLYEKRKVSATMIEEENIHYADVPRIMLNLPVALWAIMIQLSQGKSDLLDCGGGQ